MSLMRVISSAQIVEPAVVIERATDSVLVLRDGLVDPDVVALLDKLLG